MYSNWDEFKRDWVAALRSGDYKQGTQYLCIDNSYCCLGVAFDLLVKNEPTLYGWVSDGSVKLARVDGLERPGEYELTSVIKDGIPKWLANKLDAIVEITPEIGYAAAESGLINANDTGMTFSEIANIIEEKL